MTPRSIAALGVGQCVNWGVLYYAFAVLVLPLQRELGVDTWVVTGAFSLALLMSAALAPAVGRWGDRDRGPLVMQAGGYGAAAILCIWTFTSSVPALYAVWALLGLCMAAALYEPAFVIVGRACRDATTRLRALAAVTLFGGLASTVFLPLTAFLVDGYGWRRAILTLAGVLVLSTSATRLLMFRHPASPQDGVRSGDISNVATTRADHTTRFAAIAGMFTLVSLASAAFTTNLVPALSERGVTPATAAVLGGFLGLMQLPGRALLMSGTFASSPSRLLTVSLGLQAVGLAVVAFARSLPALAAGIVLFALGAGLTTLVRPLLVHTLFDAGSGGLLNGRIARQQQLARAAGPIGIAWLAGVAGYTVVFAVVAAGFAAAAVAAHGLVAGKFERAIQGEPGRYR